MNESEEESHRSVHRGEVSRRNCNDLPPLTLLASSDWVFLLNLKDAHLFWLPEISTSSPFTLLKRYKKNVPQQENVAFKWAGVNSWKRIKILTNENKTKPKQFTYFKCEFNLK